MIDANQTSNLISRVCRHLGVAYSSNQINPGLADVERSGQPLPVQEHMDAVGRQIGLRFRPMEGSLRDLVSVVSDSGPVVIGKLEEGDGARDLAVILPTPNRRKFILSTDGGEKTVSAATLRRDYFDPETKNYRWLLVQPTLAAADVSRYHYDGSSDEPMTPLQRLHAIIKPEMGDVRTILIFSIVIGLLSLTTPLAVEAIVNTIAFGRYLQPLLILSLIVMIFLGFRAALQILMTVVAEYVQRKIFVRTVEDLSYRLTRVPLPVWRKYHGPELVNRFFDIVNVQKITAKLLLSSLMLVLQTIIGLSVLAFYHPFLLGYDIGLLALMTVVLYLIGRGAVKTAKAESQVKYETAAWLQEIVRHPSTFKFNGGLGYAINRADELAASYIETRESHFAVLIRQISFSMMMQVVAATVLLALGGYLVITQQLTLGQLVAAELIVTVILGSFAKLGRDLEGYYDLMASVDKLGKLFDLPIEPVNKLQLPRRLTAAELSLKNVKLDNKHKPTAEILIPAGCTTAIHGSSELRRSKLMEVMLGHTKPNEGYVLVDRFRIDSISADSLQESVSLIREIELFDGTVDENIRMGRAALGSNEVNTIIDQIGLGDTVTGLDQGLLTPLNVSGYPLSQGQAIRLVLARTLIALPGVVFIDGLLDRLSDEDTIDVLNRLTPFARRTTFIISTGRKVIAEWADKSLDIGVKEWQLAEFAG